MKNTFKFFGNLNRACHRQAKVPLLIIVVVAIIGFSVSCGNSGTISNEYFSINLPSGWKEIDASQFDEVRKQMERQPGIKFTGIQFFGIKILKTDMNPESQFYFYNTKNPFHVLRVDIYAGSESVENIAPYVMRTEDYDGTPQEFRKINGRQFFLNGALKADKSYYDCEICSVASTDNYIYTFHINTSGKGVETGPKIIKSIKLRK
jgi:hypothetical protein